MVALPLTLTILAALVFLLLWWVHVVSRREQEFTAARRSLVLAFLAPLPFVITAWVDFPGASLMGTLLLGAVVVGGILLLIPTGRPVGIQDPAASGRLDERTIMFSRAALEPGSTRFEEYYSVHPEHRPPDDRFRNLPGLMSPASREYEPLSFAAAGASFDAVTQLAGMTEGPVATEPVKVDSAVASTFLKNWATKLGAIDCGVTTLRDYHVYSVKGRGPHYGQDIDIHAEGGHRFAVAFTVEMDHGNLGAAPAGPTLMESAQQYLESGAIAVQIAAFIRRLGYEAEAHIDGNYKVVCPLVARDAGLGEIGRMGLLMTPTLGPRVRIAVVTTNLQLDVDARDFDPSVLHFCSICKKCADVCPPRAIPTGAPEMIEGSRRWRIDQEACFSFWCAVGTDCGKCMKICPYSHPDNALHNVVRWGLKRSWLFRHFALRMDDLLYGRKPGPLPYPSWIPERKSASSGDPDPD